MIMAAEKSHDLPPAGWRPGIAGGVAPVQPEGLRTRQADGVGSSQVKILEK